MPKIKICILPNETIVCFFEQGSGTNILTVSKKTNNSSGNFSMESSSKRITDITSYGQVIFKNFEDDLPKRISSEEEEFDFFQK